MSKWRSILITIALQAAQILVPQIPNENLRNIMAASILLVNGAIVKKTSETNPDGTPAAVPYIKEIK